MRAKTHLLTALGATVLITGCLPRFEQPETTRDAIDVTPFSEIQTDYRHLWTEPSHPFSGAAIIDVDGDGRDEVFVGGGRNQSDGLLTLKNGRLVNIIQGTGLDAPETATHGAASSDMDFDGDVDLVVARENGLTIYLNDNGVFRAHAVPLDLPTDGMPMSVSVADFDLDGHTDIYVSVFVTFTAFQTAVFNDPDHAKKNILLMNNGDLTFSDRSASSGAQGLQNTFHTTFVDLDNDNRLDMVLSQNTGQVEILRNNGNGTFDSRPVDTGFGFWMGTAVGDIDQDGDQDIFVTNVGTSIPDFLTSGDLKDDQRQNTAWILLRNDGEFEFSDITKEQGLSGYGFGWGAEFSDINLDGYLDLLVAQNYIKWPLHKIAPLSGKALLQLDASEGLKFYSVPGLGLDNDFFAQSPLIADLDGDGRPDVIWLNMDGPLRAMINQSNANFLTLELPDNAQTLGAKVILHFEDGTTLNRQVVASTGLMTDLSTDITFGLGSRDDVVKLEVTTLAGQHYLIERPALNETIRLPN